EQVLCVLRFVPVAQPVPKQDVPVQIGLERALATVPSKASGRGVSDDVAGDSMPTPCQELPAHVINTLWCVNPMAAAAPKLDDWLTSGQVVRLSHDLGD